MESIDKLREWWRDRFPVMDKQLGSEFREHVAAIEREVADMRGFCDRLDDAVAKREDVTLWGVDYTAMPVDADGVPIHVGDVLEWPDTSTAEVVGIGNDTFFYVEDGEDAAEWSCANDKIHHHAPTVEDVLREFAEKVTDSQVPGVHPTYEEAIAEYVAKLTLRGDE